MKTYNITPIPKCRMTRRDKWLHPPRPCVARYRAFCTEILLRGVHLPTFGAAVTFYIPMPQSWSKKKKKAMDGQPHQQTPDLDNLLKALSDACYQDDSVIWHYSAISKRWGKEGRIEINV